MPKPMTYLLSVTFALSLFTVWSATTLDNSHAEQTYQGAQLSLTLNSPGMLEMMLSG